MNSRSLMLSVALVVSSLSLLACPENKTCSTSTCPNGCCDATGTCQQAQAATACGVGGNLCIQCAAGQNCQGGFCVGIGGSGGSGGAGGTGGTAGSGGTGGTGGSGGSGGSGGTGGAGNTLQDFIQRYSEAACAFGVRCGYWAAGDVATCEGAVRKSYFGSASQLGQLSNIGLAGDPSACIASLSTAACSGALPQCYGLYDYVGLVPNGGRCTDDSFECSDVSASCAGAMCARTCQAIATGGAGQPCKRTYPRCGAGLFCESSTNLCTAGRPAGAACVAYDECQDNYCSGGFCVAVPGVGQTCRSSYPQCRPGAYCTGGSCAAAKADGQTCLAFNECLSGRCVTGRCVALGNVGSPCTYSGDCNTDLSCDSILRSCQAFRAVGPGERCTTVAYCSGSLTCRGVLTNPDGGVGTPGTCGVPMAGDACSSGTNSCPQGHACVSGRCTAATVGTPCQSSGECAASDYCTASKSCAPRFATGALCERNTDSCANSAEICTELPAEPTTFKCRPRGALGAACVSGSCSPLYACVSGTCQPAGHAGQPCIGGGLCIDGACPRDGGVCVPKQPVGQPCDGYLDCVSGACDRVTHTCSPACP